MKATCRSWWRNCALEPDSEILDTDRLEDDLAPLPPQVATIRELISTFELCHHKSERWIHNIIEAIGQERTQKGLGTHPVGQVHPIETVWQNACAALSAWCAGSPGLSVSYSIGALPAASLLGRLGVRTPLKEWQVYRVIDKIRSSIHWPQSCNDVSAQYQWLLLSGDESLYREECPACYQEHHAYWLTTARTILHDTENGYPTELSLALAIDMLWPCHWNFVENLSIVLDAIGGKLNPEKPFAACGRNIALVPHQERLARIIHTLRTFGNGLESQVDLDQPTLERLGGPNKTKQWLAVSLAKTICLQLNPSTKVRAISTLAGPAWIHQ